MDSNNLPLEYDEPLPEKAMILMTDGMNTMTDTTYTAYGWLDDGHLGTTGSGRHHQAQQQDHYDLQCNEDERCHHLHDRVRQRSNTTSKNLMKNCASEADFYFFPHVVRFA